MAIDRSPADRTPIMGFGGVCGAGGTRKSLLESEWACGSLRVAEEWAD